MASAAQTDLVLFSQCREGEEKPLGLGYISAYLKKYLNPNLNVSIKLSECTQPRIDAKRILEENPKVIGLGSQTPNYGYMVRLAALLRKETGAPIVLGGCHISMVPETIPNEIDIAVIGEGEQTMLELMKLFLAEGRFPKGKLAGIKGIAYRDSGKVKVTAKREPIVPLDRIPFPDRALFEPKGEIKENIARWGTSKVISMMTSRGCPYSCIFCPARAFWETYRCFSPEYVISEMKQIIADYPNVDTIMILDDLFVANSIRLAKIVDMVTKEGINKKVRFWVHLRADKMDDKTCKLLKKMNTYHVFIGFESASPRMLKLLKNNTVTVEQNDCAYHLAKKYGFDLKGGFMIGSPTETREDMEMTYEFIRTHPMDVFGTTVTTPFPGTKIWELAEKRGLVSKDMDFDDIWNMQLVDYLPNYERYSKILLTDRVSKEEFFRIYQKFMKLYTEQGRPKEAKLALKDVLRKPSLKMFYYYALRKFFGMGIAYRLPAAWKLLKRIKYALKA